MAIRLQVSAHMVRVILHDSGHLVLCPGNPAAAVAYLHLNKREDVVLQPGDVDGIRDMVPSDDGILHGWMDVCTRSGMTLRVPYRRPQAPFMRELMRVLEQEHGYPPRDEIGKREPEGPVGLEHAFPKQSAIAL